jgi:hypothetical protein
MMRVFTLVAVSSDDPTRIRTTRPVYIFQNSSTFSSDLLRPSLRKRRCDRLILVVVQKRASVTKRTSTVTTVTLNKTLKMVQFKNNFCAFVNAEYFGI